MYRALVHTNSCGPLKSFPANITFVRPLVGVYLSVEDKLGVIFKNFSAYLTRVPIKILVKLLAARFQTFRGLLRKVRQSVYSIVVN